MEALSSAVSAVSAVSVVGCQRCLRPVGWKLANPRAAPIGPIGPLAEQHRATLFDTIIKQQERLHTQRNAAQRISEAYGMKLQTPLHSPMDRALCIVKPSPTVCSTTSDESTPPRSSKKRKPRLAATTGSASASPASSQRLRNGRAMTNAERGRAFRERRNKRMGEMEVEIYRLRTEIAELESVRAMWDSTRLLTAKTSDTGSLVRLVNEYFSLFRYGFQHPVVKDRGARHSIVSAEVVQAKISCQEHFLRQTMAHDAVIGDGIGPEASIANWSGYTYAHGGQRIDLHHIRAIGSEDHLVTEAHVTFNGKITMNTFRALYPRAIHRHDLLAAFLHRTVRFHAVFRHEFSADGKIQFEGADIDFVDGLLSTGAALADVMELLRLSIMSPANTIADRVELLDTPSNPLDPEGYDVLDGKVMHPESMQENDPERHKLRMEYILAG